MRLYILDRDAVQNVDFRTETRKVNVVSVRSESCENSIANVCNKFVGLVHFYVWHKILEYMSHGRMSIIFEHAKIDDNKRQLVCEICPMAKQYSLHFPISHISSTYTFKLLHVDT